MDYQFVIIWYQCWSTIIIFTFTSWKVLQCLHTDEKRWYWQKKVQSWLLFVV